MTEDAPPQAPPPRAYPPIAALRRSRSDRKLFGVAGGLGHYAGVDPLIFRILFVVLAIFGGSGILLYALGWLLIPEEGEDESEGQRLFSGHAKASASTVIAMVVVLLIGLAAVGATLDTGPGLGGLGALAVVGAIVVLLLRNGRTPTDQVPNPPTYGPVPPSEPGAYGQTPGTAYVGTAPAQGPPAPPSWTAPTQPVPPPPPPPPPRERSVLGRVTVSAVLIVVGLMVGWNGYSDDDFKVVAIFGAALAVVGIGLLVGAFVGRARGLIVLGVLLALATSISSAADQRWGAGVGERTWTPQTEAAAERPYRLGIGDAELDLTQLPPGERVDVDARLGVGSLRIYVPRSARVVVDGQVGAGNMELLDEPQRDGTDVEGSATAEPVGAPSGTEILIDAAVGLGELRVVQR